ncbi:hypothetical protein SAMN04487910_4117 [Aquimarina amphilecti]|uniref:Uncharacterized protein n=1 Tax=Aquimarina amphilecti TaxID=1038014 RepID=A0A1H7VNT0_AQUAM|nr:hypothetical protein [Aquimarina amphilecti]SEM10684.1 hypothetical protein SAMN04487910_4117 [Aquimarina amphilecti]
MKNKTKLSLDKIKIAKLNNLRYIVGGSLSFIEEGTAPIEPTDLITAGDTKMTSTKTGAGSINTTAIETNI